MENMSFGPPCCITLRLHYVYTTFGKTKKHGEHDLYMHHAYTNCVVIDVSTMRSEEERKDAKRDKKG